MNGKQRVAIMRELLGCKNDAKLAKELDVYASVISKISCDKMPIGATHLITLHEETGLSTKELKAKLELGA